MKKLPILLFVFVFMFSVVVSAQETAAVPTLYTTSSDVDLAFFYGQGCPHCAAEEAFLEEMQKKYPTLKIESFEVYSNNENREKLQHMAEAFGGEIGGVPTTFINSKMITGFSDAIGRGIEQDIRYCIEYGCQSCLPEKVLANHS
ncbi:glutaredoxin family protein, partial [Nanoarchaeota archaeon]